MNSSNLSVDLEVLVFCGQNVLLFFCAFCSFLYDGCALHDLKDTRACALFVFFFSRNVLVANLLVYSSENLYSIGCDFFYVHDVFSSFLATFRAIYIF